MLLVMVSEPRGALLIPTLPYNHAKNSCHSSTNTPRHSSSHGTTSIASDQDQVHPVLIIYTLVRVLPLSLSPLSSLEAIIIPGPNPLKWPLSPKIKWFFSMGLFLSQSPQIHYTLLGSTATH